MKDKVMWGLYQHNLEGPYFMVNQLRVTGWYPTNTTKDEVWKDLATKYGITKIPGEDFYYTDVAKIQPEDVENAIQYQQREVDRGIEIVERLKNTH